jgi:hypothetical protein
MKNVGRGATLAVAAIMMLCALGAFPLGTADHVDDEIADTGGAEPLYTGVQRTVMLEEFTFVTCHFCHELAEGINGGTGLYGTVDSYGFDQIAPLWTHTSGGSDPIFVRNPEPCVQRFMTYYGSSANPYTWIDGSWRTDSEEGVPEDPEIHAWFDQRLPVPSNISIASAGSLAGNTGSVTVLLEAVNDINCTDLKLHCALWEDHIQIDPRFYDPGDPPAGSPPSGEFRFACWEMVPDSSGTPIWPNGAKKWDTLEITHNFTWDPTWGLVNGMLGMSIWVQCDSSQLVEQAHVEDFGNFYNHEPWLDLTHPAGEGQVLSGTETVSWTATDLEDSDATLDITLEYSPDGGSSWLVLESGTANNDGTFTWNTTALADGVNYVLKLSAADSGSETAVRTFRQPFSVDNTADDEWFFQVSGPANLDLGMGPCERNRTTIGTVITATGQYVIGRWETTDTFTDATINGNWTFDVYGYLTNSGFNGYLYTNVYASSDPVIPLYPDIYDDEDVGLYQTSHLFTWTGTLSGVIPDGDSLIIELCLDVTAGKATTFEQFLSGFGTGPEGWQPYHFMKQNLNNHEWLSSGGNPGGWISTDYWYHIGGPEPLPDCGAYWEYAFTPTGTPQNVMLNFDWRCSQWGPGNTATLWFYVFIDDYGGTPVIGTEVWGSSVTAATSWASVGPLDVSGIVTSASTYFLKLGVWEVGLTKQSLEIAGYDNVDISWQTPESIFVMETDFGETGSGVVPSLGSTHAIGPLDVGWNFVSTPLVPADGSVPDVLLDLDGDTTWTVLQHFDAFDPADPWKSWSAFAPQAVNDLGTADNTVGLWLFIPDAPSLGDSFIRVAGTRPGVTFIDFKDGWNMVGYPSATARQAIDTLPGVADRIAVFDPVQPYRIREESDLGSVTMEQGRAYWVHVTADAVWAVNP